MLPEDPALPAAPHLLGPGARPLLEAALAATGGELVDLRRAQVLYRPGRALTVRFSASVRWHGSLEARHEVLMAGTTPAGPPPGTLPLEAGDLAVGVWRYPFDPALPGLALAVGSEGAADLTGRWLPGRFRTAVYTYRPGRRAVIAVTGADGRMVFLKVVPPAEVAGLVARHRLLHGLVPVPEVLDADGATGVVVLRALPGEDLRDRLRRGERPLPVAEHVLGLLDRLAGASLPGAGVVAGPLASVRRHGDLLSRLLPTDAPATGRLVDALGAVRPAEPLGSTVVHGDFHEAQLRVTGPEVVGLLDLEGVGPGCRLDDLATFLGHLATLALGAAAARASVEAYGEELRRGWLAELADAHPAELDRRVAAVVLGLATGPFRVQEPDWRGATRARLELARRWQERAERAAGRTPGGERALMAAS